MNKKLLLVSLPLLLMLQSSGCSKYIASPKPAPPAAITPTEAPAPTAEAKDYSEIGFKLVQEEILYILNNSTNSEEVADFLGEPQKKSEAEVWGADGLEHQTWYYDEKGLEIAFVMNSETKQIVSSIKITDNSTCKTSRGIGPGSGSPELRKAYENEIDPLENPEGSDTIVAGTMYGGLVFNLENDLVTSIFIGAAAE
ncbi:MAG TPA: hypothetical protein VN549_05200 [Negativicutes bacterium]|nr:hypothetical protein [Negativicutes bacterium]